MTAPGDHRRPPSEQPPASASLRILSIDGGGIRGVMPAVFLAALEELLAATLAQLRAGGDPAAAKWGGIEAPRIAECFHLIAGTSTGGLLTAGLTTTDASGRPKLTAADAAAVYHRHGAAIFHRPLVRNILDHFGLFAPKYPLAQLRAAIELDSVLGSGLLKDARTDVLILTYDAALPGPRSFTRWGAPGAGSTPTTPTETMVEVALATAAAPTYFDPEEVGSSRYIDGGMYAGNPALAAISMALRRTTQPVAESPADLLLISLGTGAWSAPLDYGGGGVLGWLAPRTGGEALLEALLGGSGDFANEAAHMILNGSPPSGTAGGAWWEPNLPQATLGGGPRLWRYQPTLPAPWAMDDVSKLPALTEIAQQMTAEYAAEMQRLATLLVKAGPVPA
jgi:hypothetical protein